MQMFGMTIWYPDMTLTCYGLQCPRPASNTEPDPEVQTDKRFKIFFTSIQYSPDDPKMRAIGRPSDIIGIGTNFSGPPKLTPTRFKGLQSFSFKEGNEKRYGPPPVPPLAPDGRGFIQTSDRPYELHLLCGLYQCVGDLYSESHHLSAHMILTRTNDEVIDQTDDFVTAVNGMFDNWTGKSSRAR